MNNIASSFGALASRLPTLHDMMLTELGLSREEIGSRVPRNEALDTVASGPVEAWKLYGQTKAVILVLVEELNQNIADQRLVEFRIAELSLSAANCVRLTFRQSSDCLSLDGEDRKLMVTFPACKRSLQVAVVYFRTGYMPSQYDSEADWAVRLLIERSKAIKCPSIGFHLAGAKKIQQVGWLIDVFSRQSSEIKF